MSRDSQNRVVLGLFLIMLHRNSFLVKQSLKEESTTII